MIFLRLLVSILVLAGAGVVSSEPSLESSTATTEDDQQHRKLSFQPIAGYVPATLVTNHNALDLDQQLIQQLLARGDFMGAYDVYKYGAFSKSVATLFLKSPLDKDLKKNEDVFGISVLNKEVRGFMYLDYPAGSNMIRVQYTASENQDSYLDCQVGGNPDPNINGCFEQDGNILVNGREITYNYTVLDHNTNERVLIKFSTEAEKKMWGCETCPYKDFEIFYNYYGQYDYADIWIEQAFAQLATNHFTNGNADFSLYGDMGRVEAIQKGISYMSVWMYVIRELEDSIDDCNNGCSFETCNVDKVHAWDEAVAFYTGSLEGQNGEGTGVMPYALAEKRCKNFATCTGISKVIGVSHVNREIFQNFNYGQRMINDNKCEEARPAKERIATLMTIPLIQGTLRYAYLRETQTDLFYDRNHAEGAVFAASVLPYVHHCNEDDAKLILDQMRYTGVPLAVDFKSVKEAFERNYECMNITCVDVGGIYDDAIQDYLPGTAPCDDRERLNKGGRRGDANVGLIVGLSIGGVALVALIVVVANFFGPRASSEIEMDTGAQY